VSTETRNFAAVRYAFNVNGRRVEGTRIGIADDPGNFQVAEKLRLYPVKMTPMSDTKTPAFRRLGSTGIHLAAGPASTVCIVMVADKCQKRA
jgi:hypothetical protein